MSERGASWRVKTRHFRTGRAAAARENAGFRWKPPENMGLLRPGAQNGHLRTTHFRTAGQILCVFSVEVRPGALPLLPILQRGAARLRAWGIRACKYVFLLVPRIPQKHETFAYRGGSTLIRTVCVAFLQGSAQISRVSRCNWPGRSGGARQGAWTVKTQEFWHTGPHGTCFCGKSSIPGGHLSSGAWGVGLTRDNASDWRPQLRGAVAKRWISFEAPCFAMVRRVRWCENDVFLLSTSLRG